MADTPIAYWKGDESGSGLADSSGNGRNVSGASLIKGCSTLIWEDGDKSTYFPNSATIAFPSDFMPSGTGAAITLEAWVKIYGLASGAPALYPILRKGSSSYWELGIRASDGAAVCSFYNSAGTLSQAVSISTGLIDTDEPVYVMATIDTAGDGKARIYVNDTLEATASTALTNIKTGTATPEIMQCTGYAGHLAVYNTALSNARALAHFAAGER
jgi:hypothetical protein